MAHAAKKLIPLFDRVLIKKAEAIARTSGGIMIPEEAQSKVLEGTVVAVGPGSRNQSGDLVPMTLKIGDHVLLPKYGGTKVEMDETDNCHLFRESEVLAILEK